MKKYGMVILLAFLIGVTLFSVVKYISVQRENNYLYSNLNNLKNQLDSLETQRQNLLQTIEKQNQQNSQLTEALKLSQDKLTKMEADFSVARKSIEELNSQVSLLKTENIGLIGQNDNLKLQMTQVSDERNELKARLSSLAGLKKAIRDLKTKMHLTKIELRKQANTQMLLEGNRGFIIKEGKYTYPLKVKIEVNPAP